MWVLLSMLFMFPQWPSAMLFMFPLWLSAENLVRDRVSGSDSSGWVGRRGCGRVDVAW